ncbi:hypothetical protein QWY93_15790 [Echinicola jeungdonensis]|uniref:Uncharacterized protein n=1 Tax=Echinicola jeungdonensis TaxID=709343 RepID=A0ABV5J6Y5_9BACT|nr:hypothetical protein [Echinicola jeungdonensis]MDN3670783.1 hypothetical protein [Echinicola jeungdonensis]
MKLPSLSAIKKEVSFLSKEELIALLMETAKFTTDNKQFLFFKVFGRENPGFFQEMVEAELQAAFENANMDRAHFAKKSAQSIRRKLNKYLKFTKDKTVQLELIAFFCKGLAQHGYLDYAHPVIENLYQMQLNKIQKIKNNLHEDLQYDYQGIIEGLEEVLK